MLTMRQRVADSVAEPRFYSVLFVVFGVVALSLAAGGIYGSLLYAVGQRRRELGVRMALGARGADILRLVLRQGLGQVLAGLVIGTATALAATRLLQSMVYGIATTDPVTYVAVAGLLGVVALVACLVPARRAIAQDPVGSLRSD